MTNSNLSSPQLPAAFKSLPVLTAREWELLLLLAESLPSHDVADKACITRKSYHNYKNRICRKLGFKRSTDLQDFAADKKEQLRQWASILLPNGTKIVKLSTEEQLKIKGGTAFTNFLNKKDLTTQISNASKIEVSEICTLY